METENTETILLGEPLPDGFERALQGVGLATREVVDPDESGDTAFRVDRPRRAGMSLRDMVVMVGTGFPKSARMAASALLVGFAAVAFRDQQTALLDTRGITRILRQEHGISVSVSPGLRMSRREVGASSLKPPSAARSAWLTILRGRGNANA